MSAKQKVQDVVLLLQKDRKAQVFAILGVLAIAFLVFNEPKVRKRGPAAQQQERGVGALASSELYDDLKTAVINKLEEQEGTLKEIQTDLQEQEQRIEENEVRTAEIFSTLIEKMHASQSAVGVGGRAGGPDGSIPDFPDYNPDALEVFGEITETGTVVPPPAVPDIEQIAYIGKGDSVRVKLLAGVNAPTDGTPYPVLFKLVGDVQAPDGAELPLGEARLMAAAQGSLVDSRTLFRLTNLSIRYPNGERLDTAVDGWIVGEDGIRGMQGVPIDPLGKVLGATAVTGIIGGIGQGLAAANTNTYTSVDGNVFSTVDGDLAAFAAGRGLSEPANLWSDIIRDRVNELVPTIQVFSGREATAVFSKSVKIPKLFDMLEAAEYDIYSTLD